MHITPMFANFVAEEMIDINNNELLEYIKQLEHKQRQPAFNNITDWNYEGGWQSGILDMSDQAMQPLLELVNNRAEEISKMLMINQPCEIANCWVNRTAPITQQSIELASSPPHAHAGYYIAFVYYPQATDQSGNLVILPPTNTQDMAIPRTYIEEDNMYTASRMHIPPRSGLLVAFPAWLTHYVEPNRTEEDRISIAINTRLPHLNKEYDL